MPSLTVNAQTLRDALAPLSGSTKNPLSGSRVAITVGDDQEYAHAIFYASDYITSVSVTLSADHCEWMGETDVFPVYTDYDRLCRILDLGKDDITLEVNDSSLSITGDGISASLPVASDELGRLPLDCIGLCAVLATDLLAAMQAVDHAAATANGQDRFKCVAFTFDGDEPLCLSATDGIMAAYHEIPQQPPLFKLDSPERRTLLVPIAQAKHLSAIVGKLAGMVDLGATESTFHVRARGIHWQTATLGLAWQDIRKVRENWDGEGMHTAIVDRTELLNALRVTNTFETRTDNDRYSTTTFNASPDGIAIVAAGSQGQATITISGQTDDTFSFRANTGHLLRSVNAYRSDEILVMTGREKGGIIVASELTGGAQLVAPIKTESELNGN